LKKIYHSTKQINPEQEAAEKNKKTEQHLDLSPNPKSNYQKIQTQLKIEPGQNKI
jgi:hypothetical protein